MIQIFQNCNLFEVAVNIEENNVKLNSINYDPCLLVDSSFMILNFTVDISSDLSSDPPL